VPPAGRSMITASDFTYLGSFRMPSLAGVDTNYSRGLTYRYRDGQLRLLSFAGTSQLYEMDVPTPSISSPYPASPSGRDYGHLLSSKNFWPGPTGEWARPHSAYWDEAKQKLFWHVLSGYSELGQNATIGIATLDDTAINGTSTGRYGLPMSYKKIKGMLSIPDQAASQLGGRRVAVGFGGYESLGNAGPCAMGPAMSAVDPNDFDGLSEWGHLNDSQATVLVDHGFDDNVISGARARRNTNYVQGFDTYHAVGDVGYWTWADIVQQSAVWIDDGVKHGVIYFVKQMYASGETTIDSTFTPISLGSDQWTVRVTSPLPNVRLNDLVYYPGLQVSRLISGHEGTEWTMQGIPAGANPTPVPATSGTVSRGGGYYDSTFYTTAARLAAFFYNPDDFVSGQTYSNANPLPLIEESEWAIPDRPAPLPSEFPVNSDGVANACTYDPLEKRLYILWSAQHVAPGGNPNIPESLISVYQLS
jgi:hypothetical protein